MPYIWVWCKFYVELFSDLDWFGGSLWRGLFSISTVHDFTHPSPFLFFYTPPYIQRSTPWITNQRAAQKRCFCISGKCMEIAVYENTYRHVPCRDLETIVSCFFWSLPISVPSGKNCPWYLQGFPPLIELIWNKSMERIDRGNLMKFVFLMDFDGADFGFCESSSEKMMAKVTNWRNQRNGWWFGTFLFSIYWEMIIPIDLYFSEGWLNHQADH